ncbi:hypothetical protein [Kaistella sp.]|uniref:hypothetical protein n=1 Tax=Kaistella sp. TaxID=2782235 RepID=UPI0035A1B55C
MANTTQSPNEKYEFDFDMNKITLEDLKILYAHFQIDDFGDAKAAYDKESFFKCFVEDETNGNDDAFLLIRLAAMLSSGSAKVIQEEFIRDDSTTYFRDLLGIRTGYKVDFQEMDYYELTDDGEQISVVIEMFDVESMTPLLSKYDFLKQV